MKIIQLVFLLLFATLFMACAVPGLIFSSKDLASRDINSMSNGNKILIASSQSEYKKALVEKLINHYETKPVYIKITGLSKLSKDIEQTEYDGIVILNQCIAWNMEKRVKNYLRHTKNHDNLIILTTSGNGSWLPGKKGRKFDALSGASEMTNLDNKSQEIINKIDKLLVQ